MHAHQLHCTTMKSDCRKGKAQFLYSKSFWHSNVTWNVIATLPSLTFSGFEVMTGWKDVWEECEVIWIEYWQENRWILLWLCVFLILQSFVSAFLTAENPLSKPSYLWHVSSIWVYVRGLWIWDIQEYRDRIHSQ